MIEIKNIVKQYNGVPVINNLNLTVNDGEFVVLIGPSGCGKTTTLKMINRLIEADSGDILINGKSIHELNGEKLRRNIGYVIQQIGLFPNMTVEENICVVPKLLKWSKEEMSQRTHELLELVHMPYEENAKKYPNELSGGQRQRIGVLRALAAKPPVILMDEPFGALDPITRDTLQDEVKALQKSLGITIIFVTHDMDEAIKMGDRIIFMDKGVIQQDAAPEEMLRHPANEIVRNFMGKHSAAYRSQGEDMTCESLMKKRVYMTTENRKTLECIEMMSHREVDSLVITDESHHFKGVVTIDMLKSEGVAGESVGKVMRTDYPTVHLQDEARKAFDWLTKTNLPYVLVVDNENVVKGIITKTSMSKALASVVWGDQG